MPAGSCLSADCNVGVQFCSITITSRSRYGNRYESARKAHSVLKRERVSSLSVPDSSRSEQLHCDLCNRDRGRKRIVHELTSKGWRLLAFGFAEPTVSPIPMRDDLQDDALGQRPPEYQQTLIDHLRLRQDQLVELLHLT